MSAITQAAEWSIDIEDITGSDTTIYLVANRADLVTFDFSTFNADDATLDVGQADTRVTFVSSSVSGVTFPITLSKETYTKTANGYTRHCVAFEPADGTWNGDYIAFTLTKSSVTSGTLTVRY